MQDTINNRLTVQASDSAVLEDASKAVQSWIEQTAEINPKESASPNFLFDTNWEPPFKAIKKLSKEHPEALFTLWGDAFSENHWISKSVIQAGKSEDWVVSIVDDSFESIFGEVYGQSYDQWRSTKDRPFQALA